MLSEGTSQPATTGEDVSSGEIRSPDSSIAQLSENNLARRAIRVGAWIVLASELLFVGADFHAKPGYAARLLSLHMVEAAAAFFALAFTWNRSFARGWKPVACIMLTVLIAAGTIMSLISHDVEPRLLSLMLLAIGTAAFLPWGAGWQGVVSAVSIASFVADVVVVGGHDAYTAYRWIAIVLTIVVSEFTAFYLQRNRTILRAIAEQMEAARREQERATGIARMLQSLAVAIGASADVRGAFEAALGAVCAAAGWSAGLVWIPTDDGTSLVCGDAWHCADPRLEQLHANSRGQTVERGSGVVGRSGTQHRALWTDPQPLASADGSWTRIAIPVLDREQTLAVMEFYAAAVRPVDEALVGALSAMAAQLGGLIQRKRAEEALRQSEEMFRSLVENASDIITLAEISGKILFQSPSVSRISGYSPEELPGRSALEFMHPDDMPVIAEGLMRAAKRPGITIPGRFRIRHKQGGWRVLESVGLVLSGTPPRLLVNARDITEREQFEEQLSKARDAAVAASQLKSSFLANMSHEIRTPLHIILGYSEYIGQQLSEQGIDTFDTQLDAMARAGKRLLATIQQILDFSKIEAGAFELKPPNLRLSPMLQTMIGEFRVLAAAKNLSLALQLDELEAEIVFDELCLSGALTNLIQNAIKFTETGAVTVRLYREAPGALCISVSDTGVGIDPDYLPKLFEPFTQERTGLNRRYEGSGLGLALAYRYLALNGAALSVHSEKERGSTFTISFAKAESAAAA